MEISPRLYGPYIDFWIPAEPENLITTWEDEEDEYLAREVYDHMQLNSDQV